MFLDLAAGGDWMFPREAIEDFRRHWRRRRPGRSTATHYASDVCIFFRWARVSPGGVTVHHIDQFIDWQRELGRASTTIQRRLVALRMFYDYLAYREGQEIANPVRPRRHYISPRRSLPRPASDDEIRRLFAAIGSHLRDRAMFTLMLHGGLRVGEVSRLRVSDMKLKEDRTPTLLVNGKGEQERMVYLSATGAELLEDYLNQRPESSPEEVFLNRLGEAITITGIQYRLGHHCERAGIWVTCHQLRHTFACRMIAADVPVVSIQKLLGHASVRTTQRYVRVADKKVERDYQAAVGKLTRGSGLPEGGEL